MTTNQTQTASNEQRADEMKAMQAKWFAEETTPKAGNYVMGDEWDGWHRIDDSNDFDKGYFGQDVFRVKMGGGLYNMAMKFKVTGRTTHMTRFEKPNGYSYRKVRVMITVPGDCEPDKSFRGWMFF